MSRGRGRGRGRGKPFGNLSEALGLTMPGEPPPPPILTPPPLFPPLERRPLKLRDDPVDLLTAKQELKQFMKQSPFFLKASSGKVEIERYSDKYKQFKGTEIDDFLEWHPDWKFFPSELQIGVKKRKRTATDANFRPLIPTQRRKKDGTREQGSDKTSVSAKKATNVNASTGVVGQGLQKKVSFAAELPVMERFEPLAKLDEAQEGKGEEEGEEGEEGEAEEEYYDEEVEEEDTDYNLSYFDNGEDYGGDEDDALEEGPYY